MIDNISKCVYLLYSSAGFVKFTELQLNYPSGIFVTIPWLAHNATVPKVRVLNPVWLIFT